MASPHPPRDLLYEWLYQKKEKKKILCDEAVKKNYRWQKTYKNELCQDLQCANMTHLSKHLICLIIECSQDHEEIPRRNWKTCL